MTEVMIDMNICPHCENEFSTYFHLHRHVGACIEDPDITSAVREILWQLTDENQIVPPRRAYSAARGDLPRHDTLAAQLGSWTAVARWAGLRPEEERLDASYEDLRRLSALLHDGEIGPSMREYRQWKQPSSVGGKWLAEQTIDKKWASVLLTADLKDGGHSYYITIARKRAAEHGLDTIAGIEPTAHLAQQAQAGYSPALTGVRRYKTIYNWRTRSYEPVTAYELR